MHACTGWCELSAAEVQSLFGLIQSVRNEWLISYFRGVGNVHLWFVYLLHITFSTWKAVKCRGRGQLARVKLEEMEAREAWSG